MSLDDLGLLLRVLSVLAGVASTVALAYACLHLLKIVKMLDSRVTALETELGELLRVPEDARELES